MGILEFVKENKEVLSLLGTFATVLITFYYAYRARQSQKLVEKLIDSPKVVVYLRNDEMDPTSFWVVCVENVGTGTARNVRFQPDRNIPLQIGDIGLEDIRFIKNGIDYFGNGQKYEFIIQTYRGEEAWNELTQTPLKITITYENADGKELVEDSYLDFGAWDGVPPPTYPIGSIAETTKEMVKAIKEMGKATAKIGNNLNQHADLRAGDKVRTLDEFKKAMIDGYNRQRTTIPKGAICTVLEVTQEEITIEWDHASDEEGGRVIHRGLRTAGRGRHNQNPHMGRVIHRGQRQLSRRELEREKIKLPPKQ